MTGCATIGDFCDLASAIRPKDQASVDWMVANDPEMAREILTHNRTGERLCDW